jgi:hypothetical protein
MTCADCCRAHIQYFAADGVLVNVKYSGSRTAYAASGWRNIISSAGDNSLSYTRKSDSNPSES